MQIHPESEDHAQTQDRQKTRRLFFILMAAVTVIAAIVTAVIAPFDKFFGEEMALLGRVVPPIIILLIGFILAWLIRLQGWRTTNKKIVKTELNE